MANYYDLLGVGKNASKEEIKSAYRKLAKEYHKRGKTDQSAQEKLKEINQAYEVLENDQKRAAYDRYGTADFSQGQQSYSGGNTDFSGFSEFYTGGRREGMDIFDIFDDLMGMGQTGAQPDATSRKGSDIKYNMSISLEDAFFGIETEISFSAASKCEKCKGSGSTSNTVKECNQCKGTGSIIMQHGFFRLKQTCPQCKGAGKMLKDVCRDCSGEGRVNKARKLKVSVPPGVQTGQHIKFSGEGEAGVRGAQSGDLFVAISIKEHSDFKLKGSDLYSRVPISFATAVLGGQVRIKTVGGETAELKVSPGTQSEQRVKVGGFGMPKLKSQDRGNLFVDLYVDVPKRITDKQRELLLKLKRLEEESEDEKGFLDKVKDIWK